MRAPAVLACLSASVGTVHADDYPQEYTDRPILHPAGMWVLDLGLDFPTFSTTTDVMGTRTTKTTSLGHVFVPSVGLDRSFGAVEVGASFDGSLNTGASLQLGELPAQVSVSFDYVPPIGNIRYFYDESISVAYKALLVPRRFALYGHASAGVTQFSRAATTDLPASSGVQTHVGATVLAETQLVRRLAWLVSTSIAFVPSNSSTTVVPTVYPSVGSEIVLALGRWDLDVGFSLIDVTGTRLPRIDVSAQHRF